MLKNVIIPKKEAVQLFFEQPFSLSGAQTFKGLKRRFCERDKIGRFIYLTLLIYCSKYFFVINCVNIKRQLFD